MKNSIKLMMACLLIATSYTRVASAHNVTGTVGSATGTTTGAAATDTYQVTCNDDGGAPNQLFAQVMDLAPVKATLVSMQILHPSDGRSTSLSEDPIDGDKVTCKGSGKTLVCTGGFSPGLTLVGGKSANDQIYIINVNKQYTASTLAAQKGSEIYDLQLHCQTAAGVHTGTGWIQTQNQ
jgi:hypothetical protein